MAGGVTVMKEGFDGFGVEDILGLLDLVGWVPCLDTGLFVTVLETVVFEEFALTLTGGFDGRTFVGSTFGLG